MMFDKIRTAASDSKHFLIFFVGFHWLLGVVLGRALFNPEHVVLSLMWGVLLWLPFLIWRMIKPKVRTKGNVTPTAD